MVRIPDGGEAPDLVSLEEAESLLRARESPLMWLRTALVCLVLPVVAGTSSGGSLGSGRLTPDELLAGTALGLSGGASAAMAEDPVLAVSPEMREFLDKHVDPKGSEKLKLLNLTSAVFSAETFGLVYDDKTRTASEAFRTRHANCFSFSNMFVAMARAVGLTVQFQEVDIPPDWTFDKETYVLNQHVNVFVDLHLQGTRVVDFDIADFKASYEMRRIPDTRALAHYYNNIGVARMQAGDTASALSCFRTAIAVAQRKQPVAKDGKEVKEKVVKTGSLISRTTLEPNSDGSKQFSPAWTNLGTLYLRTGHPAHAEAAYLQAVKADPSDLVAMSDLARLYEELGDRERAAAYRKRVMHHRYLNPYYRSELARQAYTAHDYDTAIGHLKYAIHKRPKEDQFYFLLGACYLDKGDKRAAERWLAKAQEVASTDALKRRYSSKIDTLLHQP